MSQFVHIPVAWITVHVPNNELSIRIPSSTLMYELQYEAALSCALKPCLAHKFIQKIFSWLRGETRAVSFTGEKCRKQRTHCLTREIQLPQHLPYPDGYQNSMSRLKTKTTAREDRKATKMKQTASNIAGLSSPIGNSAARNANHIGQRPLSHWSKFHRSAHTAPARR